MRVRMTTTMVSGKVHVVENELETDDNTTLEDVTGNLNDGLTTAKFLDLSPGAYLCLNINHIESVKLEEV